MTVDEKYPPTHDRNSRASVTRWATVLAALLIVVLVASGAYILARIGHLEDKIDQMQADSEERLDEALQLAHASRAGEQERIAELERQLEVARAESLRVAGKARTDAIRRAEEVARRLEQEQKKYQQQVANRFEETQGSNKDRLKQMDQGLDTVEADVAGAKTQLTAAREDVKRLRTDLGFMSGMVATNAKELAALRKLGDRDYKEFTLKKSRTWTQVATVNLKLRKADAKRHRYTIELLADDRVVEKKDRYVNEPVQFYLTRSNQPYELVINEVTKDQVSGYLAVPKQEAARQ